MVSGMAPRPGFEPGLEDSKSSVLPLDDLGTGRRFKDIFRLENVGLMPVRLSTQSASLRANWIASSSAGARNLLGGYSLDPQEFVVTRRTLLVMAARNS